MVDRGCGPGLGVSQALGKPHKGGSGQGDPARQPLNMEPTSPEKCQGGVIFLVKAS